MRYLKDLDYYRQIPLPGLLRVSPLMAQRWNLREFLAAYNIFNDDIDGYLSSVSEAAKKMFGVKYAIPVDRGLSGLYLGIKAAGIKGDVILPSFMFRGVAQVFAVTGNNLVFADIEENFTISPDSILRMITPDTKAILMTHMFGKVADIDRIRDIAVENGVILIENICLAAGAEYGGKTVGSFGDFAFASFSMGKSLKAPGGGLFLTDSRELYERAAGIQLEEQSKGEAFAKYLRSFKNFNYSKRLIAPVNQLRRRLSTGPLPDLLATWEATDSDDEFYYGFKPKSMNSIQGGIIRSIISRRNDILSGMRENGKILGRLLKDVEQLILPESETNDNIFTYYPVILKHGNRWNLGLFLRRWGIETKWGYYPLHLQTRYSECRRDDLPFTESVWDKFLYLPVNYNSSYKELSFIAEKIKLFFKNENNNVLTDVKHIYKRVLKKWQTAAPNFWWGDHLDVRFYAIAHLKKLKNKKILDIGCNAGVSLSELDHSNQRFGIDIQDDALQIAGRLDKNVHVLNSSMYTLPFKDNCFDVITILLSFPYWNFPVDAVQKPKLQAAVKSECLRVLKKEGTVFLATPNGEHPLYANKIRKRPSIGELIDFFQNEFDIEIYGWNSLPTYFQKIPSKIMANIPLIFDMLIRNSSKSSHLRKSKYFFVIGKKK